MFINCECQLSISFMKKQVDLEAASITKLIQIVDSLPVKYSSESTRFSVRLDLSY